MTERQHSRQVSFLDLPYRAATTGRTWCVTYPRLAESHAVVRLAGLVPLWVWSFSRSA